MNFFSFWGKNVTEIVVLFQDTFKKEVLCKAQVRKWYLHFKCNETSLEDQTRRG